MVRPRRARLIRFRPEITYFKPQGVGISELDVVELTFDELECLRLSDLLDKNQTESADLMGVHQSTFQRTLKKARQKLADALINGKAIKINGGDFKMPGGDGTGPDGKGPKTGRGLGRCAGNDKPGYMSDAPRRFARGFGRGAGRGRGRRGL